MIFYVYGILNGHVHLCFCIPVPVCWGHRSWVNFVHAQVVLIRAWDPETLELRNETMTAMGSLIAQARPSK